VSDFNLIFPKAFADPKTETTTLSRMHSPLFPTKAKVSQSMPLMEFSKNGIMEISVLPGRITAG
jgi:hypothetical protein